MRNGQSEMTAPVCATWEYRVLPGAPASKVRNAVCAAGLLLLSLGFASAAAQTMAQM